MTENVTSMEFPQWANELERQHIAAKFHQFVIDGNIKEFDLNPKIDSRQSLPLVPFVDVLVEKLWALETEHILYFSLTKGMRFFSRTEGKSTQKRTTKIEPGTDFSTNFNGLVSGIQLSTREIYENLKKIEQALKTTWYLEIKNSDANTTTKKAAKIAVIINNLEKVIPEGIDGQEGEVRFSHEMVRSWGRNPEIAVTKNISILLTENRELLPQDIRSRESGNHFISVPIPDIDARKKYFEVLAKQQDYPGYLHQYLKEETAPADLAQLTKGFRFADCQTLTNISMSTWAEQVFTKGTTAAEKIGNYLAGMKNDVIRNASRGMLEPINATLRFDNIGGLENVKTYFKEIAAAIVRNNEKSKKIIPKGVLLAGPPGTGKSILAHALASATGINLVRMGNIRSMWVGESERNLTMVLSLLKAISPVIVFVDEIDQALGDRSSGSGDSGVSGRIFQQILEFMGDNKNRGEVIWIAATNRADLLDDAMISRFDRIFPVLLPGSRTEWVKVIEGIAKRFSLEISPKDAGNFIADENVFEKLNQHSGRSMETVLRLAYQEKLKEPTDNNGQLKDTDLIATFKHFKSNIDCAEYALQTLISIAECNDVNYITPPNDSPDTFYTYGSEELDKVISETIKNRNNNNIDELIKNYKRGRGY